MLETLLQTKLVAPPKRPHLVPRPALVQRLHRGLRAGHQLTLISAPAGFGKTTLVNEWVGALRLGSAKVGVDIQSDIVNLTAWLSLDGSDNDLVRFFTYFIAALKQSDGIGAAFGKDVITMLQSPQPLPAETILTPLLNELTALSGRLVLILDDYHLIEAQPIHDALGYFIENSPPEVHLALVTRADPPLPLSRLRARGQLTEIRAVDLRFTSSETADFLNQVMDLSLSTPDIAALETRTEGWITGLQLAALSLKGSDKPTEFVKSFTGSHRYVLDYLIEEVLGQQPATVQTFLLQTAVLDRLTAPLCDALTGRHDGQAMLETLERANLFTIPLDDQRRWYRYHHLFGDLLQRRLRQTQSETIPALHLKAGEWLNNRGLNQEAINHLLAGKHFENAAELIEASAFDIIQQGKHATVVWWINAFPEKFLQDRPYLSVLHARALQLTGEMERSAARLIDAEKALHGRHKQADQTSETIHGLIHSCRAYSSFMVGDIGRTISHARQALKQLPATAVLLRVQTALYLGVAYRFQGQLRKALDIYRENLPDAEALGGHFVAVLCYLHLGDLHTEMAQLAHAKTFYEQALTSTEQHTGRPDLPYTGYVYVSIGRILRQWNRVDDAYRLATKGLALCRRWHVADILALSCLELAYLHQLKGNDTGVRASLQEAIQIYDSFSPWGSRMGAAHQARIDLQRGDLASAVSWAEGIDLDTDEAFVFQREIEYLVLARVFIAQEQFAKAHALTAQICQIAQESGKRQTELEALILLAVVFSAEGKIDRALDHLRLALSIGEPAGYIRIFVDEGQPMARLLREALQRNVAPDYVRRLLAAFPVEETVQTAALTIQGGQSDLVEPLSEREIEILQKIAEGLTNREIAERLYLSLNTVKAHTRNIYGKLDVHSRTQAVARARALGMLPSA